jgi:hypothetical protein
VGVAVAAEVAAVVVVEAAVEAQPVVVGEEEEPYLVGAWAAEAADLETGRLRPILWASED